MDVVCSPAGEFVVSLNYDIRIEFAGNGSFPQDRGKELLGEAWADFWEIFAGEICSPDAAAARTAPPGSLSKQNSHLSTFSSSYRETAHALTLHPSDLGRWPLPEDGGVVHLNKSMVGRHGRGARPSSAFAASLTPGPQIFPGEWFAVGVGRAFNGQGDMELGIVLKVELIDFEAEQGSLNGRGLVILKFYGVNLLLPLFLAALTSQVNAGFEKLCITRTITRQLSEQIIRCDVTGGFHFSRADLIEKFTHRLSVQGPSGVCELQSALAALGYSPGHIDGKAGPMYRAAAKAFAVAWGLSESDIHTPVFFNFIARALTGERPPGK